MQRNMSKKLRIKLIKRRNKCLIIVNKEKRKKCLIRYNFRLYFNIIKGSLISDIVKGNIGLVVENKDRLCRFGFELFETFCRFFGTKIVIINELNDKSYEQELTDDFYHSLFFDEELFSQKKTKQIKKAIRECRHLRYQFII